MNEPTVGDTSSAHAWVADVGATSIRVALADASGQITPIAKAATTDFPDPELALSYLFEAWSGVDHNEPVGVGFCLPAAVHPDDYLAYVPTIPGWQGHDLSEQLNCLSNQVRRVIMFDPHAGLLGEWWQGNTVGPNTLFLAIGTGISSAFTIDGHLARGAHRLAGVMAQPVLGFNCHVEQVASGTAVARQLGVANGAEAIKLALQGDRNAARAFKRASAALMQSIATVTGMIDLDTVVVGGGFGVAGFDLLFPSSQLPNECRFYSHIHDTVRIARATVGSDAQLLGVAAACFGLTPRAKHNTSAVASDGVTT